VSVADVYDAMTTSRPYRPALSEKQALKELKNPSLYDQRIVWSLCDALRLVG
jgi:HD-GYP domain-containing protein (c-di-GMP phosphodiesterase class II)